jgi:hypothetical protein
MKSFVLLCFFLPVVTAFSQSAVPSGDWPFLSVREVDESDFENETPQTLRLMRNEIFARHGYIFKSVDLVQHFKKQPWYKPAFANVDAKLTPLEKSNIAFVAKMEKALGDAALTSPIAKKIKRLPFLVLPLNKSSLKVAVDLGERDSDPNGEAPEFHGDGRALYGLLPDTSKIYAVVWLAMGPNDIAPTYVITITTLDKRFNVIDSAPIDIFKRYDEFGSDGSCSTSNETDLMSIKADWSYYAEHSGKVTCYDLAEGERKKPTETYSYSAVVSGQINRDGTIDKKAIDTR